MAAGSLRIPTPGSGDAAQQGESVLRLDSPRAFRPFRAILHFFVNLRGIYRLEAARTVAADAGHGPGFVLSIAGPFLVGY